MSSESSTLESISTNHWSDSEKAVDVIHADGYQLDAAGVDLLLQAMSSFAPPRGDLRSMGVEGQAAIQDAIAVAWKPEHQV